MARLSRIDQLRELAKRFGLECETWAPGDGKRRFMFLSAGGSHKVGSVVTIANAEKWMDAFISGYQAGQQNDGEV